MIVVYYKGERVFEYPELDIKKVEDFEGLAKYILGMFEELKTVPKEKHPVGLIDSPLMAEARFYGYEFKSF